MITFIVVVEGVVFVVTLTLVITKWFRLRSTPYDMNVMYALHSRYLVERGFDRTEHRGAANAGIGPNVAFARLQLPNGVVEEHVISLDRLRRMQDGECRTENVGRRMQDGECRKENAGRRWCGR